MDARFTHLRLVSACDLRDDARPRIVQDHPAHPRVAESPPPSAAEEGGARPTGEDVLAVPQSPLLIPRGHTVGGSGLPLATMPVGDAGDSDEIERLEGLLAARAGELARERGELSRLRALLRDGLERFAALPPPTPRGVDPAQLAALRAERERAVERAIEAEAARTEAGFRLDQALGRLLTGQVGTARVAPAAPDTAPALRGGAQAAVTAPDTAPALRGGAQAAVAIDEEARVNQARLTGTVRGLNAALSESEEARDMANARRLLVEHDLEDARDRITGLSRMLVEAREQAELGDVHTRALSARLEGSVDARIAATARGEALGARARIDEAERALVRLGGALDYEQQDGDELRQALGEARAELATLRSESAAMQERIADLDRAVTRETENSREVNAQANRQHAERSVLHEELARARAELLTLRAAMEEVRSSQSRARDDADAERSLARQAAAERHARAERMADALREVRALLGELPAALMRTLSPDLGVSRDPTLPGTVSAFEGATVMDGGLGESVDEALRALEGRVTAAIRVLRGLQDEPQAVAVRGRVDELLRLLELS